MFWDSLPDGWGELLVKRYLAKQGINYDRLSPLTKLSLIGENGLGGLNYEPSQFAGGSADLPDFDTLAREVDKILNDENADDLDAVYRLGGSSGGARPKAHLHIDGEEWIVKFPCRHRSARRRGAGNTGQTLRRGSAESMSTSFACSRRGCVRGISAQSGLTGRQESACMFYRSLRCWKRRIASPISITGTCST